MFRYSTIYINVVSFVISIIIFLIINLFFSNIYNISSKATFKAGFKVSNTDFHENENIHSNLNIQIDSNEIRQIDSNEGMQTEEKVCENEKQSIKENIKQNTQQNIEQDEWYLEIPSINLKANIKEGTTKEIMDDYIGHFEETSKDVGNVGLAAHNRGYKNNYFENLKKLKEGDIIYYKYNNIKREYVIEKHIIIKDTDWTKLEETDKNIITLITCVENQPEYRRCLQAIEK